MKFCANCGQPAHRYGSTDPEHKPNLMGCINTLRHQLELREAALNKYGRHKDGCAALVYTADASECDCGLQPIFEAIAQSVSYAAKED